MKQQDLGDFLREQTGMNLISQGDGLASYRTDISIAGVSESIADKIREYIADFYQQQDYNPFGNNPSNFDMHFRKKHTSKAVVFSYFKDIQEVRITAITIGKGGIVDLTEG